MRRNQRDKTHCSHEGTPNSASNIRARFDEGKMVQRDSRVTLCARFVSRRRLSRVRQWKKNAVWIEASNGRARWRDTLPHLSLVSKRAAAASPSGVRENDPSNTKTFFFLASLFSRNARTRRNFSFSQRHKQKNWVRPTTKYKGTRRRRKSLPVQSEESAVLRHFFQFQDAGLELTNPFLALYDRSTPR